MELLIAIAALCQVTGSHGDSFGSATYMAAAKHQLQCQQSYLKCLESKSGAASVQLEKCVAERKL